MKKLLIASCAVMIAGMTYARNCGWDCRPCRPCPPPPCHPGSWCPPGSGYGCSYGRGDAGMSFLGGMAGAAVGTLLSNAFSSQNTTVIYR